MNSIIIEAHAKINLGLDVTGVLPNGYHTVKMVMQSLSLHDTLKMNIITSPKIVLQTNLSFLPVNEGNIVYKAIDLFKNRYDIKTGVFCKIEKRIPVSAGMAGGSTDAAAALIGLNSLFDTKLSVQELCDIGVKLGADVPYCIMGGTALAEGIGEILTPIRKPPRAKVLIVKPPFPVSTQSVYQALALDENSIHPDIDGVLAAINEGSYKKLCDSMGNILEDVTCNLHPEIKEIKQQMIDYGADASLMSGSGPTVFGLFNDKNRAERAYYEFRKGIYGHSCFLCNMK